MRTSKMVSLGNPQVVIRKFEIPKDKGAAALLVGSNAEGLPLNSVVRNGKSVTAIYKK